LAGVGEPVSPLPPFRVVEREARAVPLRRSEGGEELRRDATPRFGRDAGGALGKQARLGRAGSASARCSASRDWRGKRWKGVSPARRRGAQGAGERATRGEGMVDENGGFGAGKPDSVPRLTALRSSFLSGQPCGRTVPAAATEADAARMRHTRGYWTGRPATYFALHRKGFFEPPRSRGGAVGSYPTFSLSPGAAREGAPPGYLFSVTLSVDAP